MPLADYTNPGQLTLNGVQDYIAEARRILQDKIQPYRYDDTSLVAALNKAMLQGRQWRPDLFVFNLVTGGTIPHFTSVDGTFVPIEPQFRQHFLNGVVGYACMWDQEDYQDARSNTFMNLFSLGLIGRPLPGIAGGSGPGRQP